MRQFLTTSAAAGLLALVVGCTGDAAAYQFSGHRWDHTTLTHTESAELAPYVALALREWGQTSAIRDGGPGGDIAVSIGEADGNGAFTQPWIRDGDIFTSCHIVVSPAWRTWPEAAKRSDIAHEIGHCLGMEHAEGGVMTPVLVPDHPNWFTPDDRAGIAALYPRAPHRREVAGRLAAMIGAAGGGRRDAFFKGPATALERGVSPRLPPATESEPAKRWARPLSEAARKGWGASPPLSASGRYRAAVPNLSRKQARYARA